MVSKDFGMFVLLVLVLLIPKASSLSLFGLFHRHNEDISEEEFTSSDDGFERFIGGIVSRFGQVKEDVRSAAVKVADGVRITIDGAVYDIAEAFGAIASKFNPTIFPGTNWCGAGDRARAYDDFGIFGTADHCCRAHDRCPEMIPPGETVYGLKNDGQYTLSHCDCDDALYRCLKSSSSLVARKIGATFFNILGMRCFKNDYPLKCVNETSSNKCELYQPDTSASKAWQWFDAKCF